MGKNYTLVDVEEPQYALVCKHCGAVVINTKLHDAYHEKVEIGVGVALGEMKKEELF
jgi:hypothetical protein